MSGLYRSSICLHRFQRPGGNALLQFGISCRLSCLPAFANSAYSHLAEAGFSVNLAGLKPASELPGGLSRRAGAAFSLFGAFGVLGGKKPQHSNTPTLLHTHTYLQGGGSSGTLSPRFFQR